MAGHQARTTDERSTLHYSVSHLPPVCDIASPHLPNMVVEGLWGVGLLGTWVANCLSGSFDGPNRAMVIGESLARVAAATQITSSRWRSYLPPKQKVVLTDLALCCASNCAIIIDLLMGLFRGADSWRGA